MVDAGFNSADNRLETVGCSPSGLCVAVDLSAHVITSANPTGGAGAWTVTQLGITELTGALQAEAGALKTLAHAGKVDDTSSYATDIGLVTTASRQLSAAPGGLRRFELGLPSFGPLHLAAPPQTFPPILCTICALPCGVADLWLTA